MLSADSTLTPDEVKFELLSGATSVNGDSAAKGQGTVRATRALRYAQFGRANGNVTRSEGTGSLDGARGSAEVEVDTPVTTPEGDVVTVPVVVEGERTAEIVPTEALAPDLGEGEQPIDGLDAYDDTEFLDADHWDASTWGASHWGASQWGASRWGASRWGVSTWGSSQWWASRWG